MSIEKLYSYSEKLEALRTQKSEAVQAYEMLINALATSKSIVRGLLAKNFQQAQAETKKNAGNETLELWAANKFRDVVVKVLGEDKTILQVYQDYIYLEEKEKTLSKIIESYGSDISSCQSEMKYNTPQ
jgi:hypothetical protein